MKEWLQKNHRPVFYITWLLLGLLQSGLTELQDDEAYYWVYSKFLAWGYFDHPPMTALLVKMGSSVFPGELGVRFFPLLLNLLSLLLIEKMTAKKNPFLFYAIVLSVAVLQLAGFTAVPDIPLIFFTALFFWRYQKFTEKQSWGNTMLLGLCAALLLYSKYHAVLIILFTLLSAPKLFTQYKVYLAGLLALLLFLPHLWWQYQHNWISIRYHLFESNVNPYQASFTVQYILGQLLLAGPVAGLLLLPAAFSYRTVSPVERALKFTLAGIYAFFLLSSFRGKVEGNWTSPALVPLIVLSHQFVFDKIQWKKWLLRLLPVTLTLVMAGRIIMVADVLPVAGIQQRYHAWKSWPQQMKEKTKGLPVVFNNSYQRASKYWFYSGQTTYSLNLYKGRRNNFDFWPVEDSLLGKPVYVLDIYDIWRFADSLKTPLGYVGCNYEPAFASFARIKIDTKEEAIKTDSTGSISMHYNAVIPDKYARYIRAAASLNDTIRVAVFNKEGWLKDIYTPLRLKNMVDESEGSITITPGLRPGRYHILFAINNGPYYPTHNSEKIALTVK